MYKRPKEQFSAHWNNKVESKLKIEHAKDNNWFYQRLGNRYLKSSVPKSIVDVLEHANFHLYTTYSAGVNWKNGQLMTNSYNSALKKWIIQHQYLRQEKIYFSLFLLPHLFPLAYVVTGSIIFD